MCAFRVCAQLPTSRSAHTSLRSLVDSSQSSTSPNNDWPVGFVMVLYTTTSICLHCDPLRCTLVPSCTNVVCNILSTLHTFAQVVAPVGVAPSTLHAHLPCPNSRSSSIRLDCICPRVAFTCSAPQSSARRFPSRLSVHTTLLPNWHNCAQCVDCLGFRLPTLHIHHHCPRLADSVGVHLPCNISLLAVRRFRLLHSVYSSPAFALSHRDRVADSLHVSLLTPHLPTTWHAPSVRGFTPIHCPHTSRPSSLHSVPQLPDCVNVVRSRAPFAAHVRCTRSFSRLRFHASHFSALPTPTVSSIASTSVSRWCTFADSARVASVDRFHRSRSVHTSQPSPLHPVPPVRRFRRLHSDQTSQPTPSPHRCVSITVALEKSL